MLREVMVGVNLKAFIASLWLFISNERNSEEHPEKIDETIDMNLGASTPQSLERPITPRKVWGVSGNIWNLPCFYNHLF